MITESELIRLGFVETHLNDEVIFIKNNYGLKRALGKWMIIGVHTKLLTGLTWIETLDELKCHYLQSTNKKL